jgi:Tol biopolymer transport system component
MAPGLSGAVWKADVNGGHPTQLAPGNNFLPQITPDDRYVIFTDGSHLQPWIAPLSGGKPDKITEKSTGFVFLSPDGKSLAFASRYGQNQRSIKGASGSIVICDLPACTERLPLKPPFEWYKLRWSPDGAIAYVRTEDNNIWVQAVDGSPPHQLTHFTDGPEIVDYAWSRDGKRLAIARATISHDIVLLKGLKPNSRP